MVENCINWSGFVRRKIKMTIGAVAIVGVLVAGFVGYNYFFKTGASTELGTSGSTEALDPALSKMVSVLLVGADQRSADEKFNTDTIILASIDPETSRISLLSIPRDTRISLTGHGYVKINAVAALTDLPTLQKRVQELTGVPISGYIQTNFQGFKKIIDTLGGVSVDVEKDMYYETGDTEDGVINLKKGLQRLDGAKALQYARFRHDALADISRTARQQVVLKAVAKEMFQLSTIPKLPFLVPQFMQAIHTNLSVKDILTLGKTAVGFDSANVVSQTLPGSFLNVDGISYWSVDQTEVKKIVQNLLLGITTDKVIASQSIDLLTPVVITPTSPTVNKPTVPTIPTVPGNPQDPNGPKSTGYQAFE